MINTPVKHIAKAFPPFLFFSCEEGNGVGVSTESALLCTRCGTPISPTRGAIWSRLRLQQWISRSCFLGSVTNRAMCTSSLKVDRSCSVQPRLLLWTSRRVSRSRFKWIVVACLYRRGKLALSVRFSSPANTTRCSLDMTRACCSAGFWIAESSRR